MSVPTKVRTSLEAGPRGDLASLNQNELATEVVRLRLRLAEAEAQAADFTHQHSEIIKTKELAELANRSKSEFVTNMSHEVRTPLNAIIGFAEILTNEMLGPLGTPKYLEYAHDILSSGRRFMDLISDILEISVVETGALNLRKESINVAGLYAACEGMVRNRARESGLSVTVEHSKNPPVVFADSRQVKPMILNLLSNALKFTQSGELCLWWLKPDRMARRASPSAMERADLSDSNLAGAVLCGANLTGANWAGAILTAADLRGAAFDPEAMKSAYFGSAKMAQVLDEDGPSLDEIVGLHLPWAESSGVKGQQAILSDLNLSGEDLRDVNLAAAKFDRNVLFEANFSGADLAMADLSMSDSRGANFRHADLRGASLRRGVFNGCDFSGADCRP